jgi:hypothetical protein
MIVPVFFIQNIKSEHIMERSCMAIHFIVLDLKIFKIILCNVITAVCIKPRWLI